MVTACEEGPSIIAHSGSCAGFGLQCFRDKKKQRIPSSRRCMRYLHATTTTRGQRRPEVLEHETEMKSQLTNKYLVVSSVQYVEVTQRSRLRGRLFPHAASEWCPATSHSSPVVSRQGWQRVIRMPGKKQLCCSSPCLCRLVCEAMQVNLNISFQSQVCVAL